MFHRVAVWMLAPIVALSTWTTAEASFRKCHRGCGGCSSGCAASACSNGCASGDCGAVAADCGPAYVEVERTIMVPTMSSETRTVNVTRYRQEPRSKTYTVMKCVPETKSVDYEYTVMVPENRSRTVTWN